MISNENVWVNTQKYDFPVLMDFDLTNTKKWARYFKRNTPQQSIQPALKYSGRIENIAKLESRLQKFLVEKFMAERNKKVGKPTKWVIMQNLREALVDCEEYAMQSCQSELNRREKRAGGAFMGQDSNEKKQGAILRQIYNEMDMMA